MQNHIHLEAQSWCHKNGIQIYAIPDGREFKIVTNIRGLRTVSSERYPALTKGKTLGWSDKIWSLYLEKKQQSAT